ncbi:MAG: hypothetical protein EZS28_024497 [Streblomastix strix]|uniref:Uncharacterized protein n=1 Tax=Streblomastix strix TaxID=222440 RepID=A0A5J4VBX9_9EUKA|nr:MAG: hypothetical protein EZS28_024497 [Streblomastix strix]
MLSPFGTSFFPLFHPGFLPNPSSELKVQKSNAYTITNPLQTTPVVEWEELRFKSSVERDRAAKQQEKTRADTRIIADDQRCAMSGGKQSTQMIVGLEKKQYKKHRAELLLIAFRIYFLWPTPQTSRGSWGNGPSGNVSQQKRKK